MTIKQLINQLSNLPPDMEVLKDRGVAGLASVEMTCVKTTGAYDEHECSPYYEGTHAEIAYQKKLNDIKERVIIC